MANAKKIDFEASLSQLEKLVNQMEDGDLTLEESLKAFEAGMKLNRECQRALRDAEQKVEVLMRENDEWVAEPLDDATDDDEAAP